MTPHELRDRYLEVRRLTEVLCAPLAADDYQIQSVPEVSPPKWHLAHCSWFFETFVLQPYAAGHRVFHPLYARLFNSYYESMGAYHPRAERHVLSRPTVEEVYRYRACVDERMLALLDGADGGIWPSIEQRITLGLHHEQQHQELLLMDIKRNFLANPLWPAYRERPPPAPVGTSDLGWIEYVEGLKAIGFAGAGFCFDNEQPRHRIYLQDYRLATRLITNGEYLEFVEAGGYDDPRYWLADGWRTVRTQGWRAPLYWIEIEGRWHELTLHGCHPLELAAPVCHVSYYEADAYARWRGCRLPSEAELEIGYAGRALRGNLLESGHLHPRPDRDGQWFGDLWEWTASAYAAYPGYRPPAGALGEYNGKFMANQWVLRGGSCVTPASHLRPTYRNFYYPHDRWPFTGIRLAADGPARAAPGSV